MGGYGFAPINLFFQRQAGCLLDLMRHFTFLALTHITLHLHREPLPLRREVTPNVGRVVAISEQPLSTALGPSDVMMTP